MLIGHRFHSISKISNGLPCSTSAALLIARGMRPFARKRHAIFVCCTTVSRPSCQSRAYVTFAYYLQNFHPIRLDLTLTTPCCRRCCLIESSGSANPSSTSISLLDIIIYHIYHSVYSIDINLLHPTPRTCPAHLR